MTERASHTCGTCNFCVRNDGEPYCVMKDLYTTVEPDKTCDEKDAWGQDYWAENKEGKSDG